MIGTDWIGIYESNLHLEACSVKDYEQIVVGLESE
jgi:hypothetical protein